MAQDKNKLFPEASELISRDFYVDLFMLTAYSVNDAIRLDTQISSILKTSWFKKKMVFEQRGIAMQFTKRYWMKN